MLVKDETSKAPIVLTIGADDDKHAQVRNGCTNFDAAACECFDPNDKKRILAIVRHYPGGVKAFNDHVKGLATTLFTVSRKDLAQPQPSSSAASSACAADTAKQTPPLWGVIPGAVPEVASR